MFLQLNTGNAKLGPMCATTYAPIANSCPVSCPLRDSGCYGQSGPVAIHGARLNAQCYGLSDETVAILEAAEIADGAERLRKQGVRMPLRLHTFGDARTVSAAVHLANACEHWPGDAWTYTHAWRNVPRAAWGRVSVLASVESVADAKVALRAGYAPAIVVQDHPSDGRAYDADGVRVIPCPNQTRGVTCSECRLCWRADALAKRGAAIAFAAHGSGRKRALKAVR